MTVCEQIGAWAASLGAEDLPQPVAERGRLQLANMLAARAAGEEAAHPVEAVAPPGPVGEVYRGAAASIAHDWDDYLFMGHTCHSAVWASVAFNSDPERALVAQVAANEVAGRLGAALFLGPHNGQFWASIHCAGAAVAAGMGLGLDAERLAHAVAIALYQPPYGMWPGFMGPSSKLLTAAEPAAQGARAAMLAREGMDGALDVIENPRGVLASLSFTPLPGMLGGLGEVWLTDTLAFKPRPGCAYLQAALDAVLGADVAASDVEAIEIEAGYLTCAMEELGAGDDLSPVRVNFSAALSSAVALIAGRLTHHELRPQWLADNEAEIRDVASRVSVTHDLELTLATLRGSMQAGVDLRGLSAREWLRVGRGAREAGTADLPLGWDDLRDIAARPELRRELRDTLRGAPGRAAGPPTIERLDTERMRLAFPCRARIRLRSGREIEIEGDERGACGRPVAEQRAVVEEKCALTGWTRASCSYARAIEAPRKPSSRSWPPSRSWPAPAGTTTAASRRRPTPRVKPQRRARPRAARQDLLHGRGAVRGGRARPAERRTRADRRGRGPGRRADAAGVRRRGRDGDPDPRVHAGRRRGARRGRDGDRRAVVRVHLGHPGGSRSTHLRRGVRAQRAPRAGDLHPHRVRRRRGDQGPRRGEPVEPQPTLARADYAEPQQGPQRPDRARGASGPNVRELQTRLARARSICRSARSTASPATRRRRR